MIPGAEVVVGGFGATRQAKLRTSIFRPEQLVALKVFKPQGDREDKIRVIAVSQ